MSKRTATYTLTADERGKKVKVDGHILGTARSHATTRLGDGTPNTRRDGARRPSRAGAGRRDATASTLGRDDGDADGTDRSGHRGVDGGG